MHLKIIQITKKLLKAVPIADPRLRKEKNREISNEEVPTPIKPKNYEPPLFKMNEIEIQKNFTWELDYESRDFFLKTSIVV